MTYDIRGPAKVALNYYLHEVNDGTFRKLFRVTRGEFDELLEVLINDPRSYLHQVATNHSRTRYVQPKQALAMWLLYHAYYGATEIVAATCGFHSNTVLRFVHSITDYFNLVMKEHIYIPSSEQERADTARTFYDNCHFPNVLLAIDGTHMIMQAPTLFHEQYINRKGSHSLTFQVAVNARRIICDIYGGIPGSLSDITLWNYSSLNARFHRGEFRQYKMLGDAIYPRSSPYFYVPYPATRFAHQINYNYWQSRGRMPVECTFGIVKRRFPILMFPWTHNPDKVRKTFIACCVVHNILQRRRTYEDAEELTGRLGPGVNPLPQDMDEVGDQVGDLAEAGGVVDEGLDDDEDAAPPVLSEAIVSAIHRQLHNRDRFAATLPPRPVLLS
eukprot:CAMPEP_0194592402 /NCGR_PEP_ID=MMETSP0292-20121207/22763_1 /TAXON_ID=39354 /ORGANISM="Heterosigma akashiwo, Strain CCMP2393" /LENGTH=386 /DNA_ID=CAMNT_0039450907 /DNA_START=6 /DNA_END=1164 /DNA_ORIENTATION=+